VGPKEATCTWAGVTGSRHVTIARSVRCIVRRGLKHRWHGPGVWACLGLGLLRPKTGARWYDRNTKAQIDKLKADKASDAASLVWLSSIRKVATPARLFS